MAAESVWDPHGPHMSGVHVTLSLSPLFLCFSPSFLSLFALALAGHGDAGARAPMAARAAGGWCGRCRGLPGRRELPPGGAQAREGSTENQSPLQESC